MIVTLLVSTGAAWESRALHLLTTDPGTVVLKRCVDVDDLLGTASTGQAQVAVLGAELPGLDAAVVDELERYGVRVVAVTGAPEAAPVSATRIGIGTVLAADRLDELAEVVAGDGDAAAPAVVPDAAEPEPAPAAAAPGRVVAVHGPAGGPGRTTVAVNLAADLADRGEATLLVDADPYGGAVAQQLGILDEVSGLLSAARLVAAGALPERFPSVQRALAGGPLRVLTGLPRPDRWSEVRPGAVTEVVEHARGLGHVVVDTGFSVEQTSIGEPGARPERNGLTVEALECADEVVLVGAADPVGLSRLARALTEVHELLAAPRVRVVVNRMRRTLGWREADVAAMLEGFGATPDSVRFLPEDQAALDRALVEGRSLAELGDGLLRSAIGRLATDLVPTATR